MSHDWWTLTWFQVKVYDRRFDFIQVFESTHCLQNYHTGLEKDCDTTLCALLSNITSLSGRLFCCFRTKSKSLPSTYSKTVQNLHTTTHKSRHETKLGTHELVSISKTSYRVTMFWGEEGVRERKEWGRVKRCAAYRVVEGLVYVVFSQSVSAERTSSAAPHVV